MPADTKIVKFLNTRVISIIPVDARKRLCFAFQPGNIARDRGNMREKTRKFLCYLGRVYILSHAFVFLSSLGWWKSEIAIGSFGIKEW